MQILQAIYQSTQNQIILCSVSNDKILYLQTIILAEYLQSKDAGKLYIIYLGSALYLVIRILIWLADLKWN